MIKRRHGLNRCRYKGEDGMKRWVGLGVIADNLINIGRAIEREIGKLETPKITNDFTRHPDDIAGRVSLSSIRSKSLQFEKDEFCAGK